MKTDTFLNARGDTLAVLSCRESEESAGKLAKLAEIAGIKAILIDADEVLNLEELTTRIDLLGCSCLAASSASLSFVMQRSHKPEEAFETLFSMLHSSLFYGFDPEASANRALLTQLVGSPLSRPVHLPGNSPEVSFSGQLPTGCRQLQGLLFTARGAETNWHGFELDGPPAGSKTLMTVAKLPVLIRIERERGQSFLLSSDAIINVDESASPGEPRPESYLSLVPWLIFLRSAFSGSCWHNPNPRAALIIDDPLLRPRYGFLQFEELVSAMDAHGFATTAAFIPWNRRRNSSSTIALFKSRRDRLSLCVHGCDHTEGEFRSGDQMTFRAKARIALMRMEELRARTGLDYDRVMVFPQGGFCKATLHALAAEGFLAALNTSVFAADWQSGDITFGDMLDVALLRYGGCPLFSRRYPTEVFPLAFDLFMGKPALIVEHHGYFKYGFGAIARFAQALNSQEPNLIWASPGEIFTQAALFKHVTEQEQWVRFYTDSFTFHNDTGSCMTYRLHKQGELDGRPHVLRDGNPIDADFTDSLITTEVRLDPGEIARIEIRRPTARKSPQISVPIVYQAKVAARRLLSEFRDSYIARNDWLLTSSQKFKRRWLERAHPASPSGAGDGAPTGRKRVSL